MKGLYKMLNIARELFVSWNDKEIMYCHWKSNEHLVAGLDGETDLDVYILPKDRERAEGLLLACKYIKFVPQKGARYSMVDEWIGFDNETGKLVHVHLHYQIITGTKFNKEYIFPVDDVMIETRILDDENSVYVTSRELELIILYSRVCLKANDKKKISPNIDYVKEITYLKERLDWDSMEILCTSLCGTEGAFIFDLLKKDNLSCYEWFRLYKVIDKWLKPYKKAGVFTVWCKHNYYKYRNIFNAVVNKRMNAHRVTRKTLKNGGLSVCFLGADGCGKSTVSQEICKWLNWKIEANRFYLGSGDHYNGFLKRILRKGQKVSKSSDAKTIDYALIHENKEKEEKLHSNKKKPFIKSILKYGFSILSALNLMKISKNASKQLIKADKYMRKGGIALFDRFPQNQFEGLYDGPKIRCRMCTQSKSLLIRILANKEEKYILNAQKSQPNIVFKLLLPPEESIRRKPDHTIEEVAPKAEITPQLVFENSIIYDVDATQDYSHEILEIKRKIWEYMIEHDNRI